MLSRRIGVMGCGWLGLPLGAHLVERGHEVSGSTTTREKLEVIRRGGMAPWLINLSEPGSGLEQLSSFLSMEALFLNIPPRRRESEGPQRFLTQIGALLPALENSPVRFVVFASSTSVYPPDNGIVDEQSASDKCESQSGRALLEAEQLLQSSDRFETTVIRFAGLYGYDRQPGRFLAGRTDLSGGGAPVNLIHRDDCIAIVTQIIEQDQRGEVFNACSDEHPTREALYTGAARRLGLEPPRFLDSSVASFKVVSNDKLKKALKYRFLHPSPLRDAP